MLAYRTPALVVCTLFVLLSSCGQSPEEVSLKRAWVRAPLPSKTTTSAYVRLINPTNSTITVNSADSETIGAIEFHKSELKEGMHRMVKLDTLQIPAKETLKLEPGGLHLMLFRVQEVKENKHVIKFHTEGNLTFQATFEVREAEPE